MRLKRCFRTLFHVKNRKLTNRKLTNPIIGLLETLQVSYKSCVSYTFEAVLKSISEEGSGLIEQQKINAELVCR